MSVLDALTSHHDSLQYALSFNPTMGSLPRNTGFSSYSAMVSTAYIYQSTYGSNVCDYIFEVVTYTKSLDPYYQEYILDNIEEYISILKRNTAVTANKEQWFINTYKRLICLNLLKRIFKMDYNLPKVLSKQHKRLDVDLKTYYMQAF